MKWMLEYDLSFHECANLWDSKANLNQIIFIGLRSSKDYYKRPGGVAGVYGKGHLGVSFLPFSSRIP